MRKSETANILKKSEILKPRQNLKAEKTDKSDKNEKKSEKKGISRIKSPETEKNNFEGLKIKKNIRNKSFVEFFYKKSFF